MSDIDLDRLAEEVASIAGSRSERLIEVRGRITRARRRRTALATGAAAALAVALLLGATALTGADRDRSEPPANAPTRTAEPRADRPLTYAVGTKIHWGATTIDVSEQADQPHVRDLGLDRIEVTDDGVAFLAGPVQPGVASIWFTDGGTPTRIGATIGSPGRGYPVAASTAGSLLQWMDPDTDPESRDDFVVFDTSTMTEVARLADAAVLSMHQDVIYWVPSDAPCLTNGVDGCTQPRAVWRLDAASGERTRITGADYLAEVRSDPRQVSVDSLVRRGDRLVGWEGDADVPVLVGGDGTEARVRVPVDYPVQDGTFEIVQWLDDDEVAVFAYGPEGGSEVNDAGDILRCRLPSGECRVAVQGYGRTRFALPGTE